MQLRPFALVPDPVDQVLVVSGDVEQRDLEALGLGLDRLVDHGGGAVDLCEVTFLPSRALGVLAHRAGRARRSGAELRVVAAPGCIADRVLGVVGLDHGPCPGGRTHGHLLG